MTLTGTTFTLPTESSVGVMMEVPPHTALTVEMPSIASSRPRACPLAGQRAGTQGPHSTRVEAAS